jgi:lysophospholipase L1-like esterase
MIPSAPVLFAQARRLRRETPLLPEAELPWSSDGGPGAFRVLLVGDSTIAGVGVSTQADGLAGQLSLLLAARLNRPVSWLASGRSGATSREVLDSVVPDGSFDLVMVSVGANDALALRSRGAFARDLRSILLVLRSRSPGATILVSSMPGFSQFTLLPDPLRRNLARHSRSLEAAGRAVVAGLDGVFMTGPAPTYTAGFFATDNFHPGASGYRDWAGFIVDDAIAQGAL